MDITLASSCLPLFTMLLWTFCVYFLVHTSISIHVGYIPRSGLLGCKVLEFSGPGKLYSWPEILSHLWSGPQYTPALLQRPLPSPPLYMPFPHCWFAPLVLSCSSSISLLSKSSSKPYLPAWWPVSWAPLHALFGVGEEITDTKRQLYGLLQWF